MRASKATNSAEKLITIISQAMGIISVVFLIAMMVLTVFDVLARKLFNSPIPGSVELIELMMIVTGFFALAWCASSGAHITVDLIVERMPRTLRNYVDGFIYLLSLGICIILARQSVQESHFVRDLHSITPTLKIPLFPFFYLLTIGFSALALVIFVVMVKSFKKAIHK